MRLVPVRQGSEEEMLTVLSISGNQPLDSTTSIGPFMLTVIAAVGKAEREAMLDYQRPGHHAGGRGAAGPCENLRRQAASE